MRNGRSASSVNPLAKIDSVEFTQFQIASRIGWKERCPADFRQHPLLISGVFEAGSVVKEDTIERIERLQCQVVDRVAAGERKELLDQPRSGDNRGATIETIAILLVDICAATGSIPLFTNGDLEPTCSQPNGYRQSAKSTAYDDDSFPVRLLHPTQHTRSCGLNAEVGSARA